MCIKVPAGTKTEMCGSAVMHEVQPSTEYYWYVVQESRQCGAQEMSVVLPCKPIQKYVGSQQVITNNASPDVDREPLLVRRLKCCIGICVCPHVLVMEILDSISCEHCLILE
jgi:hypothetical protein